MLSLGGAGPASARAAVPPPYPEWADDPLLPKPRAHPLRSIIFLCSATPLWRMAQTGSRLSLQCWGDSRGYFQSQGMAGAQNTLVYKRRDSH